ncbi:MAG: hypothetical protein KDK70_31070, partial [Myxococcales bacterium]|nr:hypothetical protein [Myxococcales bacterium]
WFDRWPVDDATGGLLRSPSLKRNESQRRPPPTRVSGPFVSYYTTALASVLRPLFKAFDKEFEGDEVMHNLRRAAVNVLHGHYTLAPRRRWRQQTNAEEARNALRTVAHLRFQGARQRALVPLLTHLATPAAAGTPAGVRSFLDTLASLAQRLEPHLESLENQEPWSAVLEVTVAHCMLEYWQERAWLEELGEVAEEGRRRAHEVRRGSRISFVERSWFAVLADVTRLKGHSAEAARLFERFGLPNLGHTEPERAVGRWRRWCLARAQREAAYPEVAQQELRALAGMRKGKPPHGESEVLPALALLELGHIEREQGNLESALEFYRRARWPLRHDERLGIFVATFEIDARLAGGANRALEQQVDDLRMKAESLGDLRLLTLLDLVRGDLFVMTDRFDMARASYLRAFERARETSDTLAEASCWRKQAFLEESRGRTKQAIGWLQDAADLHSFCERHRAAIPLLEHARRLAIEASLDVDRIEERLAEERSFAANHAISLFEWSKRRSPDEAEYPADA